MKKNVLLVKEHPLYKLRVAFSHIYRNMEFKLKDKSQFLIS